MAAFDGVYAADDEGRPQFQALLAPDDEEIAQITATLAEPITAFLVRRGLGPDGDPEEADPLSQQEPWLSRLYAAAVTGKMAFGPNAGKRLSRTGDQIDPESMEALNSPRCASVAGFSMHATVDIHAGERDRLQRLCRYCSRQRIALERLEVLCDGRLLYRFKRPWRDGTTHVVFQPLELLEKLAALVPAPRAHLVRYHGLIAPAAKWRALIVPASSSPSTTEPERLIRSSTMPLGESSPVEGPVKDPVSAVPLTAAMPRRRPNYTWAQLMKRVWELDVLECPNCQGRMRILAAIHPPDATRKILDCLGLPSRAPPIAPAVSEFIP